MKTQNDVITDLAFTGSVTQPPPVTLASAATVDFFGAASDKVELSGTASVSAATAASSIGIVRTVTALAASTLVHSASFSLQTSANIVCAAGDTFTIESTAAGAKVYQYNRKDGTALVGGGGGSGVIIVANTAAKQALTNLVAGDVVLNQSNADAHFDEYTITSGSATYAGTTRVCTSFFPYSAQVAVPNGANFTGSFTDYATIVIPLYDEVTYWDVFAMLRYETSAASWGKVRIVDGNVALKSGTFITIFPSTAIQGTFHLTASTVAIPANATLSQRTMKIQGIQGAGSVRITNDNNGDSIFYYRRMG
jgi:hypothetical protein